MGGGRTYPIGNFLMLFGGMIFGVDLLQVVDGDMGVDLGGFQGLVAEHLLQVPHRRAVFEHMSGAGVAEGVGGHVLFDSGQMGTTFDHGPYAVDIHPAAPAV